MIPWGGSDLNFIDFYKTKTGKLCVVWVVNQRRNLWLTLSNFIRFSKNFSKTTIKLGAKWQFYNSTQLPFTID